MAEMRSSLLAHYPIAYFTATVKAVEVEHHLIAPECYLSFIQHPDSVLPLPHGMEDGPVGRDLLNPAAFTCEVNFSIQPLCSAPATITVFLLDYSSSLPVSIPASH